MVEIELPEAEVKEHIEGEADNAESSAFEELYERLEQCVSRYQGSDSIQSGDAPAGTDFYAFLLPEFASNIDIWFRYL